MPRGNNRPQRYSKMVATRVDEQTYKKVEELKGGANLGEWLREQLEKLTKE